MAAQVVPSRCRDVPHNLVPCIYYFVECEARYLEIWEKLTGLGQMPKVGIFQLFFRFFFTPSLTYFIDKVGFQMNLLNPTERSSYLYSNYII